MSGELHPPDAGRAGLRDLGNALYRSGGLRGLWCLRNRLPGQRDRAEHPVGLRAAAVRRNQCVVLPEAARRREASADVEAGSGDSGRRGACAPAAADGSRRRVGPAAMYAADELLVQQGVQVNVFEKLPTPYGLVRSGVAPDHQNTKRVTRLFDRIAGHRRFRFYLNVEIGKHLGHAELLAHHHAVLYAVGAPDDRRLTIDGMGLPGTGTATELVAWLNGHPDFNDLPVDLSHERVVIIGNGNVALDVARVLAADPHELAATDIADHALSALRNSAVREVVVAARRGPAHSAFTLPELIGLTAGADVVLDPGDHQRVLDDLAIVADPLTRNKLEILSTLGTGRRLRDESGARGSGWPIGSRRGASSASGGPAEFSSRSPEPTSCANWMLAWC